MDTAKFNLITYQFCAPIALKRVGEERTDKIDTFSQR